MNDTSGRRPGRHFLQIPGPSNVPDRILRAMAAPTVDHRSPGFAQLTLQALENLKKVFKTSEPVILFPSWTSVTIILTQCVQEVEWDPSHPSIPKHLTYKCFLYL